MKLLKSLCVPIGMLFVFAPFAYANDDCDELLQCHVSIGQAQDLAETLRSLGYSVPWDLVKQLRSLEKKFWQKTMLQCDFTAEETEDALEYGADRLVRELKKSNEIDTLNALVKTSSQCNQRF